MSLLPDVHESLAFGVPRTAGTRSRELATIARYVARRIDSPACPTRTVDHAVVTSELCVPIAREATFEVLDLAAAAMRAAILASGRELCVRPELPAACCSATASNERVAVAVLEYHDPATGPRRDIRVSLA